MIVNYFCFFMRNTLPRHTITMGFASLVQVFFVLDSLFVSIAFFLFQFIYEFCCKTLMQIIHKELYLDIIIKISITVNEKTQIVQIRNNMSSTFVKFCNSNSRINNKTDGLSRTLTLPEITPRFWWDSCCLVFSFLCCVLCTIICLFVFFFLASLFLIYEHEYLSTLFSKEAKPGNISFYTSIT